MDRAQDRKALRPIHFFRKGKDPKTTLTDKYSRRAKQRGGFDILS